MRRLSHAEYRATIHALFPGTTLPDIELPRDLAVHGFENDSGVLASSPLLVERYSELAVAIAHAAVAESIDTLAPCAPLADTDDCAREFVRSFGRRAFRRPLTEAEVDRFTDLIVSQMNDVLTFDGGVELALQAFLQSPAFLFRIESAPAGAEVDDLVPVDGYEMASRLSYLIWESMPDDVLFAAAEAGELSTTEQIEAQARRMLDDERALPALVDFHRQWLGFDQVLEQEKEASMFPEWTPTLREAMAEEAKRFVGAVLREDDATVAALLTSRRTEVNAELAAIYGMAGVGSEWTAVDLDPSQRAGVLTLPAVLAGLARPTNGSPPLRGVFVLERLLCARPPDPPPNADTSTPEPPDGGTYTNRQLFEIRTSPPQCQGCHTHIDGIGFGFEGYDAIGRHRDLDNGIAVDATGMVKGFPDIDGEFDGAVELIERLAGSA